MSLKNIDARLTCLMRIDIGSSCYSGDRGDRFIVLARPWFEWHHTISIIILDLFFQTNNLEK